MFLLPPAPDVCQECATKHAPERPHNKDSLYYQMKFQQVHGRWPTWEDAMEHCDENTKDITISVLEEHKIDWRRKEC